jgi:hypothetical protein
MYYYITIIYVNYNFDYELTSGLIQGKKTLYISHSTRGVHI